MNNFKEISNKRFGRLVALYPVEEREPTNGVRKWMCKCDCGNYHVVNGNHLRMGNTKSCGCSHRKGRYHRE